MSEPVPVEIPNCNKCAFQGELCKELRKKTLGCGEDQCPIIVVIWGRNHV